MFKLVYYDAPMVNRPFSSVIGICPIGGFKNCFLISWAYVGAFFLVAANRESMKDGFKAKISIIFSHINEIRDEA